MPVSDLFDVAGQRLLDEVPLGRAYTIRVESLRDLIEAYDQEVAMADREVLKAGSAHSGYPKESGLGYAETLYTRRSFRND